VSKIIVKWFKGHELALAMGLQLGSGASGHGPGAFHRTAHCHRQQESGHAVFICLVMLCFGLLAFVFYTFKDKKLDASLAQLNRKESRSSEDEFHCGTSSAFCATAAGGTSAFCARSSTPRYFLFSNMQPIS
jgi:hypothetical protein